VIDVLLSAAEPVIEEALALLMQKPRSVRPFVVIDMLADKKRFVQFAGSTEEELLFDVPALQISTRFPDSGSFQAHAKMALLVLTERLGVPATATLRITTESDGKSAGSN
jgi:hypothetical protein